MPKSLRRRVETGMKRIMGNTPELTSSTKADCYLQITANKQHWV
jgi:hypothetical protein